MSCFNNSSKELCLSGYLLGSQRSKPLRWKSIPILIPLQVSCPLLPFAYEQTGGLLSSIPVLSFDDSVESAESGFSPEDLDSTEIATYAGLVKLSFLETKVDESLYGSGIRLWPFGKRFSKATPGFDGMQPEHWGQT